MAKDDFSPTHRDCTKCKECKPLTEFTKATRGKYGKSAYCKSCAAEYARANKGRINEASLARYHRLQEPNRLRKAEERAAWIDASTKLCASCNSVKGKDEFGARKNSRDGKHVYCKECVNRKNKAIREKYPEKAAQWSASWAASNPEKRRLKYRRWASKPSSRLHLAVVARVYESLKSGKARKPTESLIGYTFSELRAHLERQFQAGMSWENYGQWHVDHIAPLSSFSISSESDPDLLSAWSLANLRPLWAAENFQKRAKRLYLI